MTVPNENKYLDPLPLSKTEAGGKGSDIETPPVTKSGSRENDMCTPMEAAFWEYAEPYTGMRGIDMAKSSHGNAFMAGWLAGLEQAVRQFEKIDERSARVLSQMYENAYRRTV